MAYAMYNNSSSKRGYFYDVRNLPYGYYGMHPMDQAVVEYQRGRPSAKLPARQLNRQFKAVSIPFEDEQQQQQVLQISVVQQQAKQKQHQFLVLSVSSDDSEPVAASTVTLPEPQAVKLVQRLRKLSKWKPASNGQLPTFGQGLVHEDSVFKALIVPLQGQAGQHGLKILAESRSRDPQERRELSSVLLPMDSACLTKFRSVLTDLVSTETPLYHTESLQVSDGSKFYLDLIREESAHYLKVSHVTRDFRSIVIVPASDVAALRDVLDSSLQAMQQRSPDESTKDSANNKQQLQRKGGRNARRRPRFPQRKRRFNANSEEEEAEKENENSSSCSGGAATAEAVEKAPQQPQQQQQNGADDDSTVESHPVENGDQTAAVVAE